MAVALALLFVVLSAGISVGVVAHGLSSTKENKSSLSVSEEFKQNKEQWEREKAEEKAEKAAEKEAASKTTKKLEAKTSTEKKSTTAKKTSSTKQVAAEKAASTTKKSTSKATTKKTTTTTKKTTTTKTTTRKTTTTKGTTAKADGSKVIYLTFDDGPGPYTDQLLSILDKHGVKATFFVTNCYPDYQGCIAKEARAGHAVAVHSYTHNYATIYASDSAYWSDFNKMNDIVKKQTGNTTNMFRFPGGSSNTVSKKYNSGIMSRLTKQAGQKGLTYFDWNVTSGDAGETTSSTQVYKNIINQVQNQKQSIVLCHDIKSYTVNAMDQTITWCLNNGYTFKTLTPGGYTVHHSVAN